MHCVSMLTQYQSDLEEIATITAVATTEPAMRLNCAQRLRKSLGRCQCVDGLM